MKLSTWLVCISIWGVLSASAQITGENTKKAGGSDTLPSVATVMTALRQCGDSSGDNIPDNRDWGPGTYNRGYFKYFLATQELSHYNRSKSACDRVDWTCILSGHKNDDSSCPMLTFLWHYQLEPVEYKIKDLVRIYQFVDDVHGREMNKMYGITDYMFMSMPWMAAAGKITGDKLYWNKLYAWWKNNLDSGCFHSSTKLWHYDRRVHLTPNGKEAAWARAQSWAGGAICLSLENISPSHPGYAALRENLAIFCEGIRNTQTAEGYWTACPTDPDCNRGFESSGTVGMTYTIAWAINNSIVDRASYLPVVVKGWNWLVNTALQKNGKVGYSQAPTGGDRAGIKHKPDVKKSSSYTQGFFMMAGAEMIKLCPDYAAPAPLKIPASPVQSAPTAK